MKTYYEYPQEVWDEKKCQEALKHVWKDGMGTPFTSCKGVFHFEPETIVYNGGCIHDGKWFNGEIKRKPKLADGYSWRYIPTWNGLHQIVKN
jgi:hypothetical protein